jgi:hypothetical protein
MRYQHTFDVQAALKDVSQFHRRSTSLGAITPPLLKLQMDSAPDILQNNDVMTFTLGLGPLAVAWKARIEYQSLYGFTDLQLEGPFKRWCHQHTFVPLADDATRVLDQIEFDLRPHPLWWLIGAVMALGLPLMFRYRAWKTRRILEHAETEHREANLSSR